MAEAKKEPQPNPEEEPKRNPDADLLVGGPGQDTPPSEPKEESGDDRVEVTIGGKKTLVEPELAQLLEQREQDYMRKLNESSQELGRLRKEVRPKEPPKEEEQVNYDDLLFENPTQALQKFEERIVNRLEQKYNQDKTQEAFWRDFYSRNDDLKREEDDFMVKAVMQRNWGELADLAPSQAQQKIADLTRQEILRLSKRVGGGENPTPRVEGSTGPTRKPAQPKQEEGPISLSDVIKERRRSRRRGAA